MKKSRPPKTIDEYIGIHPEGVQVKLQAIRSKVRSLAPDAEEKISYGIPTFKKDRNIFHFAAFRNHIGLYPGSAAIKAFAEDLERYTTSKGAIQIPLNDAIPLQLIGKLVRFNLKNLAA